MVKKIVVIDDEPDILRVLEFRLKALGCKILPAQSGKAGIELIMREKPSLVLVDYHLPDMAGPDVARRVRSEPAVKDVPVILVTASSSDDMRAVMKDSGLTDYILKPFDPAALLATAKKYL